MASVTAGISGFSTYLPPHRVALEDWCDWSGALQKNELRVTSIPLEHPGGSLAYRLDWPDRSLAFVTDTTADLSAPYVNFIHGVDLLVHECNFTDQYQELAIKTGHSWTSRVAEVAAAAEVGQLVLTHVNPLADANDPVDLAVAQQLFPRTSLAYDGMEVEIAR